MKSKKTFQGLFMYLVYIDESGSPYLDKNMPEWFGLTGIIVHDSNYVSNYTQMKQFLNFKSQQYKKPFEIHVREIINNKIPPFDSFSPTDRMNLMGECLNYINTLQFTICSAFIHKPTYAYWHDREDYLKNTIMNLWERIGKFMQNHPDEIALLFYDQPSSPLHKSVKNHFLNYIDRGSKYINPGQFVNDIFFTDSNRHVFIQISDICCYVIRRYIELLHIPNTTIMSNHSIEFYNTIKSKFDKNPIDGQIYGYGIKIIGEKPFGLLKCNQMFF